MNSDLVQKSNLEIEPESWLEKKLMGKLTPALIILGVILLISLGFHLYNIEAIGNANTYYTAAVEAMLDSWSNFFFVAAEPGGSVTIDKPPLGLWIETAFAAVFGVSGLVVSLPNILAGLLSIPLLYHLVKKYLGAGPGLVGAAVMAFTPVVFAADRNNTMDSMLVFTLLLAAWAFMAAVEYGKLHYLLLGGLMIGLGFNIKMMQVLLPLPAFFALYFFASKEGWLRKVLNLGLTSVVILAVSLSWALAVDAVPEDRRPYIGSSTDNTVMELIVGHNGLNRLFGGDRSRQTDDGPQNDGNQTGLQDDDRQAPAAQQGQLAQPQNGNQPPSQRPAGPPNAGPQAGQMPGARPQQQAGVPQQSGTPQQDGVPNSNGQNGSPFASEVGEPGLLRFFSTSLANEASWMLPFALVAVVLGIFSAKIKLPLEANSHKALVLWGGWLVTCVVFFSVAAFFHAYYLVMLAPALGGSAALGWKVLDDWRKEKPWLVGVVLIGLGAITLVVQIVMVGFYGVGGWYVWGAIALGVVGMVFLLAGTQISRLLPVGMTVLLAAMLLIPMTWSFLTVDIEQPNINLPSAYAGVLDQRNGAGRNAEGGDSALVEYLLANQTGEYLLAVPSSNQGSNIVLATGEPVLYMGGFNGGDPVVDAADMAELVADGDLTYVLYGGTNNRSQGGVAEWLASSCTVVPEFSQTNRQARQSRPDGQDQGAMVLYECLP